MYAVYASLWVIGWAERYCFSYTMAHIFPLHACFADDWEPPIESVYQCIRVLQNALCLDCSSVCGLWSHMHFYLYNYEAVSVKRWRAFSYDFIVLTWLSCAWILIDGGLPASQESSWLDGLPESSLVTECFKDRALFYSLSSIIQTFNTNIFGAFL